MEKIILASASPRRRELLERIGIPFTVMPSDYEEVFDSSPPLDQVRYLAEMKVRRLHSLHPETRKRLVLGADTCIDLKGRILGKPRDRSEARRFLKEMSGTEHRVLTGVALWDGSTQHMQVDAAVTTIHVAVLDNREIDWYLDTGEWEGAAGGYRIQGKGSMFVERIDGCFFNVVGLPIRLFYGMVHAQGYSLL